eukprot:CAMPEP_0113468028 /NCGR_PEP_ID=MMETSP0014_2-20120614/15129_1 /TAXON_ID=2857 /ORGANISM="Nitzschia sp." /LENGTH=1075 /DNA_ID=CAMNT_0000360375 /DNA_START=266 /DNA_END=3490 /DNA_ORIENTATION=- /assembly_acc=CAM_ASM_000159
MGNEDEGDNDNDGGVPRLLLQEQAASVSSTLPQENSILNSLFGRPANVNISNASTENEIQDETNDKNRSVDQDGNDGEDAALVDSFFLPGGLLADEDEQQQQQQQTNNNNIGGSSGVVGVLGHTQLESSLSAVPSNPWQEKNHSNKNSNNIQITYSGSTDDEDDDNCNFNNNFNLNRNDVLANDGGDLGGLGGIHSQNFNIEDSPMHVLTTLHHDGSSVPVDRTPVGCSITPESTLAVAPPGFDSHYQQQHDEKIVQMQFSYRATSPSRQEEMGTSANSMPGAVSSDPKLMTSYSTTIQRQDGGKNNVTASTRLSQGGKSSAYNNRLVDHQRQQSSGSTMGEELLMKVPSPKSSTATGEKKIIGTRKNDRRGTGTHNDEMRNNNERPKGSGRLMMDQSLPTPNLDRRVIGRSNMNSNNNNSAARTSPSKNTGRPSHNPSSPNRRDDKRPSTSNIRNRRGNNTNNNRKNFSDGVGGEVRGGKDADYGWRDRRRGNLHHHNQQQNHATYSSDKKYANENKDNLATTIGVGEEETGVPGTSSKVPRGRKYGLSKNENTRMNPNTPMNIYESLDVYEQDDDNLDCSDDQKHKKGDHAAAADVQNYDENEITKRRFGECANNEGQYIRERDNDGDQPRDDDADEASIPLHICDHSLSESSISSLSTSSDGDESSISSDDEEDGEIHGEIGYDTDQAHVSHIVGIGGGSTLVPKDVASTSSSAPNAVCPAEETPFSHTADAYTGCSDGTAPENKQVDSIQKSHVEKLHSLFHSIMLFPSKVWDAALDWWDSRIRGSNIYIYVVKVMEDILRLVDTTKSMLDGLSLWISEAKDAVAALAAQFLAAIGVILAGLTKALILTASFLFQVWKYSLIEAAEESSVTLCYLLFYFMPNICYLLMEYINLPHWSPHMMSWLCVFCLCSQVEPGPLHQEGDLSIFKTLKASTPGIMSVTTSIAAVDNLRPVEGTHTPSASSTEKSCRSAEKLQRATENDPSTHHTSRSSAAALDASDGERSLNRTTPKDERACATILKILRLLLPGFFFTDGFSSEFGTIMGVSGASRLTTAFMMSLVRKNLVSSPIGW